MKKVLPPWEVYFYCASWILGVLYSTYKVYSTGNRVVSDSFGETQTHLVEGWSILGRRKDDSDEEWSEWRPFILYTLSGWIVISYVGAQVLSLINTKGLPLLVFLKPLWHLTVTSTFIIYHYGYASMMIFFLQPALFIVLALLKNTRSAIWVAIIVVAALAHFLFCAFDLPLVCLGERLEEDTGTIHQKCTICLAVFLLIFLLFFKKMRIWCFSYILYCIFTLEGSPIVSREEQTLLMPALMWIYLRCISFYLEEEPKELNWVSVFSFFGYVFYLPTFFFGPVILYYNFSEKLCRLISRQSLGSLIASNIRYLFWMTVTELILHYVYINSLLDYVEDLSIGEDSVWLMYGIGFGMGQLFFLKYTVVYGLSLTWTKAEGYNVPHPPKCVAGICLYSDMWRLFDEGLYQFIHRYIYQPPSRTLSSRLWGKLCGSCLCFVFVFIWHGLQWPIFVWSCLNFVGIAAEKMAREISKTSPYLKLKEVLGPQNESRFIGVICAPLTIASAISNFYFLGGEDVGKIYTEYIFRNDNFLNTFCLWFFVYCLCQVSLHIVPRKLYRKW